MKRLLTTIAVALACVAAAALPASAQIQHSAGSLRGGGTIAGPLIIDTNQAPALDIKTDAVGGTIQRIQHDVSTTPTSALTFMLLDMTTNWSAGNVAHTGLNILIPAHTTAAAAAEGAMVINSDATLARVIDVDVANTAGTVALLRYGGVATQTAALTMLSLTPGANLTLGGAGALTGLAVDLSSVTGPGAIAVVGLDIDIPASSSASTAGIDFDSTQTGGDGINLSMTGAAAVDGMDITMGSAVLVTGAGLRVTSQGAAFGVIVTSTNSTTSSRRHLYIEDEGAAHSGAQGTTLATVFRSPVFTGTGSYNTNLLLLNDDCSASGAGVVVTLSQPILYIQHVTSGAGGATFTDTSTGISVAMSPGAGGAPHAVAGILVAMGGNTSNAGYAATFSSAGVAGEATGNGVVNITKTGVLTGQTVGLEIDLTGTTTGGFAHIGQRILIPATTAAAANLEGAFVISSDATLARVIDVDVANTGGTLAQIRWGAATTLAATTRMLTLDGTTNVTGGSQVFQGVFLGTPAAITNASYAATFDWRGTAGTAAGNAIVNVEIGAATVFTAQIVGLEVDLATNHTLTNNVATIGMRILVPATTAAASAGEAALAIISDATVARVIDVDTANISGRVMNVNWGGATTLTNGATTYMAFFDGQTNVTPGSANVVGLAVTIPAASGTSTEAIGIDSTQTAGNGIRLTMTPGSSAAVQGVTVLMGASTSNAGYSERHDWRGSAGTASGNGILNIDIGASTTFTGVLTGIECDLSTNVGATTAVALTNYTAKLPVNMGSNASAGFSYTRTGTWTTNAAEYTGSAILISNTPTEGAGGVTTVEAGVLISVSHVPVAGAGAITDSTTGFSATITPAASGAVRGSVITMGALTSNAGFAERLDFRGTAGTAAGNGIVNVEVGAATALTGQLVGIECDLSANVTAGSQYVSALNVSVPASTAAASASQGIFNVVSLADGIGVLNVRHKMITGTAVRFLYDSATTLAANTLTGINLDYATNVTGFATANFQGFIVTSPPLTNTSSYCATFDYRNVAGTAAGNGIVNVEVGAATTHTGQLVGIECDLSSNSTLTNNVAYIGQRILIPATTRANTAAEGALVISSDATAARAIDIDIANTSGTPIIFRYGASTTPNAVTMMTVDLSTNVSTNTNANVGINVPIVAADEETTAVFRLNTMRVFVGTGAPNNANGTDGDMYWRIDGGALTSIYKRIAGVWTGIAMAPQRILPAGQFYVNAGLARAA